MFISSLMPLSFAYPDCLIMLLIIMCFYLIHLNLPVAAVIMSVFENVAAARWWCEQFLGLYLWLIVGWMLITYQYHFISSWPFPRIFYRLFPANSLCSAQIPQPFHAVQRYLKATLFLNKVRFSLDRTIQTLDWLQLLAVSLNNVFKQKRESQVASTSSRR